MFESFGNFDENRQKKIKIFFENFPNFQENYKNFLVQRTKKNLPQKKLRK